MKRCSTRCLHLHSLLLVALACGCVTKGSFETLRAERDELRSQQTALESRVAKLAASNASLDAERLRLIDEMEDMREAQGSLVSRVDRLKQSEERLSRDLAAREAELAKRETEFAKLRGTYDGLVADLEEEVASGQIEIEHLREGLRLNLSQAILFPSGSARLNARGVAVLRKVAERLRSLPNAVEVQGHTDDVAVRASAPFPSNWELAAARSAEVVRLFEGSGVGSDRLTVVSFGEHAPIASNATPEGRAKNRRIEIRLKPASETPPATAIPPDAP